MSLKRVIGNYLGNEDIDKIYSYGLTTRIIKDLPFLKAGLVIDTANQYDLIVLEMISPILNVKDFTSILMLAKSALSENGLLVFDFIEELRPMLSVARKMESWRGEKEEDVYGYTLIDIASALSALGLKIKSIDKVDSIGEKQVVVVFASRN
ncbi:MAG: hypothetical protein JJE21_07410 [Spirochaetaceae bacterium]|nr:hypothetical protein [Spirochaetaceae bacterium]